MTTLELIETGIVEGDWGLVCEGYRALTGKEIPVPPGKIARGDLEDGMRRISDIVNRTLVGVASTDGAELLDTPQTSTKENKKKKKKKVGHPKKKVKSNAEVAHTSPAFNPDDEEDSSLNLDDSNITNVKFNQTKPNEFQFITNEPDPEETKKNKARARNTTKIIRKPPRKYQAKCSVCSNKFESDRKTGKIGQTCRNCLNQGKSRFNG